jgi:hypothetical protein
MTTTTRQPKPQRFTEKTIGSFERIDRDAGVIRGVRVIGLESKNGRRYLREAVQSAKPLYEGARVYLDHQEKGERPIGSRWGRLINVREAEDGGLRADLEYLKDHPLTDQILEAAERFQDIGLSHDSLGRSRIQEGERVVYEIVEVNSVDLVEKPATTSNLWESHTVSKKKFLDVLKEHSTSVAIAKTLFERLTEMAGGSPEVMQQLDSTEVEMPMEEAATGSDDQVKAGLRQAMLAILDNDDDSATTIKKLRVLLAAQDKMASAPAADPAAADPAAMQAMEESVMKKVTESFERKFEERLRLLETTKLPSKTEALQSLLESAKRDATPERLRLLESCPEADRDALIKSWPAKATRPATSPPKYAGADAGGDDLPQSYLEARKNVRALAKTEKV